MATTKKASSNVDRLAAIREKLRKTDMGSGRGGFWSPKVGKNTIRILPEVGDMEFFYQTVGKHNFPPDGKRSVYCPQFTSQGELDCPVCEVIDELKKAGDKASKELAGMLGLRKSYWMNVVDRANEDAGPQIYTPGVIVMGSISSLILDPDYGDITDLAKGVDITIEREGTGRETKYEVRPKPRTSPLHADQDVIEEWLEKAKDLTVVEVSDDPEEDRELSSGHVLWLMPYDRIISEFDLDADDIVDSLQAADEDTVEEEETPKKSSKQSVKQPSKKTVVEDEDEDEDEDEKENAGARETRRRVVARRHR
jgi:hypothetical protein